MRDVLTVPWVVVEDAPAAAERDPVTVCAQKIEPAPSVDAPSEGGMRWTRLFVALAVSWCILFSVLLVAGALTPVRGNTLTYCVMMAGLFLAAFAMLILPRPSEYAETHGGYPVGQCTPSRGNTLTGRL